MKYSIIVNTCDGFEDCWMPFFTLFSIYWPDFSGKIYLNTEYKNYLYPGLNIYSVKGCATHNFPKSKRATWSQCFKWALESIETNIVLYLQEDYFFKGKVKNEIVDHFVELMICDENIKCIHLTDQAVLSSGKSEYDYLDNVAIKQKYRVSCQAALWRKDELLEILRTRENAWNFEHFGSMRSSLLGHRYFVVDKSWVKLNEFEIVPYIFTGIVKGRWIREAKTLFDDNGIEMDFSKRGFVDEPFERKRTLRSVAKNRYNMYIMPVINWGGMLKMRLRKLITQLM